MRRSLLICINIPFNIYPKNVFAVVLFATSSTLCGVVSLCVAAAHKVVIIVDIFGWGQTGSTSSNSGNNNCNSRGSNRKAIFIPADFISFLDSKPFKSKITAFDNTSNS